MTKAIPYHNFKEKSTKSTAKPLSNTEALIRALDLLDFYATFSSLNNEIEHSPADDDIEWIDLKFHDDDK